MFYHTILRSVWYNSDSYDTRRSAHRLPYHSLSRSDYGIMVSKRRETLDFSVFPAFFVSNLLLVQREKYYFNRFTVSRNWPIVL